MAIGDLLCNADGTLSCDSSGNLLYYNGTCCECCCIICGTCHFNPCATARVVWSFNPPANGDTDLNGSGTTWAQLVAVGEGGDFIDNSHGDVTITPMDLTDVGTGGTTGDVKWSTGLYVGTVNTLLVYYDCALNGWVFALDGPDSHNHIYHGPGPTDRSQHPLGIITGSCNGATAANATYTPDGVNEFAVTGTIQIIISNNTCAAA